MSFTSQVKQEICSVKLDASQSKAQLCALLLVKASIHMDWQGMSLSFQIENANIAKHAYSLMKTLYDVEPRLSVLKKNNLKKNNIYRLQVYEKASEILEDLTILRVQGLYEVPSYTLIRSEKNCRAFLSGCFLASGSINHPKSANYHLEFGCEHEKLAELIAKSLERFYIPAKVIQRKHSFIAYVKSGEKIADFLRLAGASEALFEFEDLRIQRDIYNQITRLDNCELANEMKSIKAAQDQLAYIETIEKNQASINLPEKLQQTMEIRKKYPEASIRELCSEMLIAYGEDISKSGMKHRLSKLKELAKPYMASQEGDAE